MSLLSIKPSWCPGYMTIIIRKSFFRLIIERAFFMLFKVALALVVTFLSEPGRYPRL